MKLGVVGLPNVGKSTLFNAITKAGAESANYPFCTIEPNVGVVDVADERLNKLAEMYHTNKIIPAQIEFVDIAGLVKGASEGAGLGHYFLRHIERVRLIVHVVDISGSEGRDPVDDYNKINAELATDSEKLANIPQIVVAGKADLLSDPGEIERFEKAIGKKVYVVSALTHQGIDELLKVMKEKVDELPPPARIERDETFELEPKSDQKFTVSRLDDGSFFVDGGLVDFLIQNVTISSQDSFAFFQKVLKDRGVISELKKRGMKEGDVVVIGDIEFEWVD